MVYVQECNIKSFPKTRFPISNCSWFRKTKKWGANALLYLSYTGPLGFQLCKWIHNRSTEQTSPTSSPQRAPLLKRRHSEPLDLEVLCLYKGVELFQVDDVAAPKHLTVELGLCLCRQSGLQDFVHIQAGYHRYVRGPVF